jgi:hypothetical protein
MTNKLRPPQYSGPNRSGMCKCGHKWKSHHLGIVMNQDYFAETSEEYLPEECEVDQFEGMVRDGGCECQRYVDNMVKGE